MTPVFNNRENLKVDIDKKPYWLSRSAAVVAEVMLYSAKDKEWYVLLSKRGPNTPDFQGYWGLPCGYLDWDETLQEAVLREVHEECGLYLPSLKENELFSHSSSEFIRFKKLNEEQPWRVFSQPSGKQNISTHYEVRFAWKGKFEDFPKLSFEYASEGEVSEVKWTKLKEAINMELAFSHDKCLKMWMNQFLDLPYFDKFKDI